MRKYGSFHRVCILVLLILLSCCAACVSQSASDAAAPAHTPVCLKIYMTGDALYQDNAVLFYHTSYSLGEYINRSLMWGPQGHLYFSALEQYEKETGNAVEVVYFDYPSALFDQLAEDKKKEALPDLIVADATTEGFNTYAYMHDSYFIDLSSYLEADRQNYYEAVLNGGKLGEKQYIFPLLFNVTVGMGDAEKIREEGLWLDAGLALKDYLTKLTSHLETTGNRNNYEGIVQFSTPLWYSLFQMVDSSSGVSLIDYETGRPCVSEAYVKDLYTFWEAYIRQNFGPEWEEAKNSAKENENLLPYNQMEWSGLSKLVAESMLLDEVMDDMTLLVEGGGYSTVLMHSALAQAYYYQSRYQDAGKEFICFGIPCYERADAYTANITMFGGVTVSCEHAQAAYEFLRYLADFETAWQLGLSVNKERTSEQLSQMTEMEHTFYPFSGKYDPTIEEKTYDGEPYYIQPMGETVEAVFQNILNHMGPATLPEEDARWILFEKISQGIIEEWPAEQVYQSIQTALEAYCQTIL